MSELTGQQPPAPDGNAAPTGGSTGGSNSQSTPTTLCHAASIIPARYKIPKGLDPLDGSSKWDSWSFRMINVFEAEEVWGIVSGSELLPTTDTDKIQVWQAKDKAARITINLAVADDCIPLVKYAKSSATAWSSLNSAFGKKGLLTAFYYRSQILNYRFNESQSFEQQITHLRGIRTKQVSAGIPSEDWDFAICLLAALPDSYSIVKQSILANETDLNQLKIDKIISLIAQEEVDRKGLRHEVDAEAAFALRQGPRPTYKGQPRRDKKQQDKTGVCNWCKREGHWEKECRKKKDMQAQAQQGADKSNQKRSEKNQNKSKGDSTPALDGKTWVAKICDDDNAEEAKAIGGSSPTGSWWEFDSGATRVFHSDLNAFSDYIPFDKPVNIGLATDGASTKAHGTGTLRVRFFPPDSPPVVFPITKAYYAPGIMSLISISHLDDLGRRIQFFDKRIDIWHGDELELSVPRVGNSYKCRGEALLPDKASAANATKSTHDLWHRRYGHIGDSGIKDLVRKELVNDLTIDVQVSGSGSSTTCDSCIRGKHARTPFPTTGRTRATKPLELVHADICGPFPPTREGYKYYLPFLDDHSEYAVVYRLKEKSGSTEALKDYQLRAEKHTGHQLKAIQTDNGGEFEGDFERHLTLKGIHHQRSTPYTPEQNGVAERLNRTLNNVIVSCLIDSNLGDGYWGDALLYAVYTRNRSPSRAIPGFVPYTLWNNGVKPSVAHLRPFGCTAYVHIPKKVRKGKLEPKAVKTIFLGYDSNRKAWRFFDPKERKEYSSRDVTFLEGVPYTSTKEDITFDKSNVRSTEDSDDDSDDSSDDEDGPTPIPIPPSTSPPLPNPPSPNPTPPPLGPRNITAPTIHTDTTWMPPPKKKSKKSKKKANQAFETARMAYEFGLAATDPRSYKQALAGPDAKQWEEAIQAEYQTLVDTGTFEVVDLPADRKAIPSTYVFKEKTGADGRTDKFKARIVARGDRQKKGIDFNEVFAPVPRLDTVRAVFAYAASQDWDIDQLDFKSAFLNGDLEEEVYMKPPEGIPIEEGKVWRLRKTLYGLRQSPKGWHKKLTGTLKEFQLVRSGADFSVYVGHDGPDTNILLTHVDDMAVTGSNTVKKNAIKERIKERFPVEDLGDLDYYLAIKWVRDRAKRTITGYQGQFALTVLARFSMLDCHPADTPIAANTQFSIEDCPAIGSEEHSKMAKVPYLEAIGSLMYLMLGTRPDLAYAIGKLSRFGHNPGKKRWKAVKRVFQYLKGTLNYSLTLGGASSGTPTLFAYSDASFQDCPDTSRSTSGYVFYLGDGPISWSSKRQSVVTNSTMEAEYLELSNAARQAIWLRELLDDLGCTQLNPTVIYGDNNASLILAQDVSDHSRAKHIKRTYHYVRERIQQEHDITVEYCPGKENIADIFTKPLGPEYFSRFLSELVHDYPSTPHATSGSVVKKRPGNVQTCSTTESQATSPRLTSSVVFGGISGIVDARGPLFASLNLEGRGPGAFIKNRRKEAVVELVRSRHAIAGPVQPNDKNQTSKSPAMQPHNGVIDIQIVNNVIIVAQNCNFNLYNLSKVTHTLLGAGESAGISAVRAYKCIDYPNLELPVYQGSLLRQPNPHLGIDPGAFALFSMTYRDFYGIISQSGWSSEAASTVTPPQVRCLRDLAPVPGNPFHIVPGPSGRRVAVLSDTHLSVYFTSKFDSGKAAGSEAAGSWDTGGLMAYWMIPGDLADIPVALDFDETTGWCVAAMASGRVWVKEAANFLSETRISFRGTRKIDFDVTEIPNPDPARWPVVMPFPGIQPPPDPPKQVARRWSNEADKYFPYKNRLDCYGSTPWLVHEVLHIPVVWPGHQPSPVGKYGARTVLFTVGEVKNEPFYDEVIEVRPLPGSDEVNRFWLLCMSCGDWEFYKLKPIGSLDDIVAHLQHCGIGALREHDEPWPVDENKLDQLSRWMDRYMGEFGKFERDSDMYQ